MASSSDNINEEECRSRLLVSFTLLNSALVVNVLRHCTIDELNTKLKAHNPPLEKRSVKEIKETLKVSGYNTDKMKISKAKLEDMLKQPGFRFDAFNFAKLFVKPDDINVPSFDKITDPKVYSDLLVEVPKIPIDAEDLRTIRNICGHNDFLKCDEETTGRFIEALKEITKNTKPIEAEHMPIIKEIEKWEKRMTRYTNKNLDTFDDLLELLEVVNPWTHIAIEDPTMKQLVDRITEILGQTLVDHEQKLKEQDKMNEEQKKKNEEQDKKNEEFEEKLTQLDTDFNTDPKGALLNEYEASYSVDPREFERECTSNAIQHPPGPGQKLVVNLDRETLRKLCIQLDPHRNLHPTWEDLAERRGLTHDETKYIKDAAAQIEKKSYFLLLIEHTKCQEYTVDQLKEDLEAINHRGALKVLVEAFGTFHE